MAHECRRIVAGVRLPFSESRVEPRDAKWDRLSLSQR
jgi:hypothetical protein